MKIYLLAKGTGILMIGAACLIWASTRHDFQITQLGDMVRNQFLVDKETGRVWQKVCGGEVKGAGDCDGVLIWEEMYVGGLTPPDSQPAQIYDYIAKKRDEENKKKETSKK